MVVVTVALVLVVTRLVVVDSDCALETRVVPARSVVAAVVLVASAMGSVVVTSVVVDILVVSGSSE